MKRNLLLLTVCSLIILIVYRLPVIPGQTRYSMEILFRMAISIILAGAVWSVNRHVSAFLGLALFSQFYPIFDSGSARAFYNVMCGVVLYYIIVSRGEKWTESLMDMMCIVALVNVVFALIQVCGYYPLWDNAGGAIIGLMENQNSLSALLALCFPAFLRRRWKVLSLLVIAGLFAAKSSGGVLAVVIGSCFYFIITAKERKQLYPIGICLVLITGIFTIFFDQSTSVYTRCDVWSRGFGLFTEHWVFGCGIGRWKTEFIAVVIHRGFPEGFIRLHSTVLQSMVEMGIGFVIILAGYLINIARRSWKNLIPMAIPLTALIIILANGSVNFLIRIAPNAALVIVWLAVIELSLRRLKDET